MSVKASGKILNILRDKDIKKAANLFGIDEMTFKRMNDQRLLNSVYIREVLIRSDYEKLTRGLRYLVDQEGSYTFPEIKHALTREYGLSMPALNNILYGKANVNMVFCKKCGFRISNRTAKRTGGLCSACFADTLDL